MSLIPQGPDVELPGFHGPRFCEGQDCPIHHPSQHHMRDWPLNWRGDRQLAERICPHGIGHPDPDHMDRVHRLLDEGVHLGVDPDAVHGCDGCCAPPTWEQPDDHLEEGAS
jgi:hypothetical protein